MHKTIKVQCQKVCNCWVHDCKTISVQYHVDLQLLHFVLQNTLMVQYQLVGSCVFACVKLCIYGQWMHLEYCQSCQSRLVHQGRCITKQFTVEFVTAKQARYSSQQIATAELIIAKLPQYNAAWFTFLASGTAKHVWSPHGTFPTRLQLLRLPFACITVHLIYGQQMHLEYDHN